MNKISNIPYISDSFFEYEKRIWQNIWLLAGHEADVNENGKFITFDLSAINVSVVILRQSSDKLSAFYNICPHRNGRLATRNALTEDWPVVEWAHQNMRAGVTDKSTIGSDMETTVIAHYVKLLKYLGLSEDELQNEYA